MSNPNSIENSLLFRDDELQMMGQKTSVKNSDEYHQLMQVKIKYDHKKSLLLQQVKELDNLQNMEMELIKQKIAFNNAIQQGNSSHQSSTPFGLTTKGKISESKQLEKSLKGTTNSQHQDFESNFIAKKLDLTYEKSDGKPSPRLLDNPLDEQEPQRQQVEYILNLNRSQ